MTSTTASVKAWQHDLAAKTWSTTAVRGNQMVRLWSRPCKRGTLTGTTGLHLVYSQVKHACKLIIIEAAYASFQAADHVTWAS